MKMPADPQIDLSAPCPGTNGGKGRLAQAREIVDGRHRIVWRCICGGCGHADASVHNTDREQIVIANLSRKGWRGFGKRIRCPDCVAARKPVTSRPVPAPETPAPIPERQVMCSATAPANILNAARVGRHLDLYWLDKAGRYEDGWTDERIGQDLGGVAPDFVRSIREGLGKVPKRPAEILEAERKMAELYARMESEDDKVAALVQSFNDALDKFNLVVAEVRVEYEACRKLIAQAEAKAGKAAA